MNPIRTIIRKEWADTLRNKLILYMLIAVPVIMVILPIGILVGTAMGPVNESDLQEMQAMLANPLFADFAPREALQASMGTQFLMLFLLMPLIVPVTIAAYSIVGEKLSRTLEPLLATPVTTTQLLIGKSLAASLPAIVLSWAAFAVFLVFARIFSVSDRVFALFVHPMWLVAMVVLSPLLAIMAVNVGVIVSSRVNDPRAAEQLGALVIIPFMALFFSVLAGIVYINTLTFVLVSAGVAILDVGLIYAGVALFQRETILTRWK